MNTGCLQLVNSFCYLLPNAYILARQASCVWFSLVIHISGFLRWTCWNSVSATPFYAHAVELAVHVSYHYRAM